MANKRWMTPKEVQAVENAAGYSGQYSLTFNDGKGDKNTWVQWHLIPSSVPNIPLPNATYKYVDIPGRDGSLDLSDYLVGRPTYSDRSGSFSFYAANGYGNWVDRKQQLASFFNGRKMKMTMQQDPNFYYEGRFFLKDYTPGASFAQVTIEYRVRPYKYRSSDGKAVLG